MECEGVLEHSKSVNNSSKLKGLSADDSDIICNGSVVQHSDNVEESENLEVVLLNDLDSYLEDIEDRLAVSRMVNDSVTRGLICAVEQETSEKIAQKESELARLKETLHLYHVGADSEEYLRLLMMHPLQQSVKHGLYPVRSDGFLEHDMLLESLDSVKISVKEQLKRLKLEIDKVKGSTSIRRKGSGSELLGLSGILLEEPPDKWSDVDKTLAGLRTTMDSVYKQFEDMVHHSKSSFFKWQQERELKAEIERTVLKTCIRSLQEEFEQGLWHQNAQFCSNQRACLLEKFKELSILRQELDTIHKSLPSHENGHLLSHGSLEHRKGSGNHVASTSSVSEDNGVDDGSLISTPENIDLAQLKHMKWNELANYFKSEMTKMKRHHELKVRDMTEQYFSLKREYLKERDSSFPAKKDKEVEMLRKKIPELILKLDNIIDENEKLPAFIDNTKNLDGMNGSLKCLHSENRQLKELLADKKKEIKSLSLQVSDAAERIRQHRLTEENLQKMIADYESSLKDSRIDTSVSEDLFRLLMKDAMSPVEFFRGFSHNDDPRTGLDIEDSEVESLIMGGICQVIFREALREAEEKLSILGQKFVSENKIRMSLEMEALEKGNALRLTIAENETLEKELRSLRVKNDEKDNSLLEAENQLTKEREKSGLVSKELENLRIEEGQQQMLLAKIREESEVIKGNLTKALEKVEQYKGEREKLRKQLNLATTSLHDVSNERSRLHTVLQEKQSALSLSEAREAEQRKQMDSVIVLVQSLSKAVTDFESKASDDIKWNNLRLETTSYQFSSLIRKVETLRKMGMTDKKRIEKMTSDLQKAENEVDLLGDEVDTLLSLLEKIYIALDHYSPILQHYPGIMEILKLVRRELSGEAVKPI